MLIVGVVLAIGIPNMRDFRQNGRMTSTANDLHSSFHQARSEAARAKTNITICASADSTLAVPVCGGQFEAGWVMFEDNDANMTVNGGDVVLKRYPPVANGVVITTAGPNDYFMYSSTGLGRTETGGQLPVATMILCDDRGNVVGPGGRSAARVVVVTPLGRATVLRDIDQVAAQGGC